MSRKSQVFAIVQSPILHRIQQTIRLDNFSPGPKMLVIAAVICMVGCGGGGNGGGHGTSTTLGTSSGPSPASGGIPISTEAMTTLLDTANAKWQTLIYTVPDPATREQAMATFLRSQAGITSAGLGKKRSVWALFSNGRHLIVSDASTHKATPDPAAPAILPGKLARMARTVKAKTILTRRSATLRIVSRDAEDQWITQNVNARVIHTVGNAFSPTYLQIEQYLGMAGYEVNDVVGTVEALKTVRDDDVLYLDSHGDYDDDGHGNYFWSIWTATLATPANLDLYKADLDDGSLVVWLADNSVVNGMDVSEKHLAITRTFIKKYGWSFNSNAVAIFGCCYGSYPASEMTTLAQPAAAAFGFNEEAEDDWSGGSGLFITDRLTGLNNTTPAESSIQRPFDTFEVYSEMVNRGIDKGDSAGACRLEYFDNQSIGLVPSIERLEMTERITESPTTGPTKLTLYGWFGTDQGTVTVGGTNAAITSWKSDTVECTPAASPGAGFSGDVVVTMPGDDRKSNAVPLTQWHGMATYTVDLFAPQQSGAQSNIKADVYFRGDVHEYRKHAGAAPIKPSVVTFRASQGSVTNWNVTGQPISMASWSQPVSGTLPFGLNGSVNSPYGTGYIVTGTINMQAGTVQMGMDFLGCDTAYKFPKVPEVYVVTLHDTKIVSIESGVGTDGFPIFNTPLSTSIGDDYSIHSATFNGVAPILSPKMEFSVFVPSAAPDPDKGEDQAH